MGEACLKDKAQVFSKSQQGGKRDKKGKEEYRQTRFKGIEK